MKRWVGQREGEGGVKAGRAGRVEQPDTRREREAAEEEEEEAWP